MFPNYHTAQQHCFSMSGPRNAGMTHTQHKCEKGEREIFKGAARSRCCAKKGFVMVLCVFSVF